MKFLVIARPRDNRQGMTSAMVEATLEKVKGHLKNGVLDCLYSFADGSGSVAIANADSGEALMEALDSPTQPFIHFEAKPLAGFERRVSELVTAMKKQGL